MRRFGASERGGRWVLAEDTAQSSTSLASIPGPVRARPGPVHARDTSFRAVSIATNLYNDPACPWAYSEIPELRVIEWRYGSQLDWRLVLIGLTEDASQYVARGYTPLLGALGQLNFRRYGMPFSPAPKPRISATARACRAVVAARLIDPGSEWRALRALQLANFTTPLVLEDDEQLMAVLTGVETRTSSPIRIKRNKDDLQSINTKGLYPTGEGAGYAGGILSAAVDGIEVAEAVALSMIRAKNQG